MPVPTGGDLASAVSQLVRTWLNDLGGPQLQGQISSLSEVGNLVTVTLTGNLPVLPVAGMTFVLGPAGTHPGYDGNWLIASATLNSLTFVNPTTGLGALGIGGTVSIPFAVGSAWTDAKLLPFINSARRQLQRQLSVSGTKTLVKEVVITLAQGNIAFSLQSGGATQLLPAGFIVPYKLWEAPGGTIITPSTPNGSMRPREMTMARDGLPRRQPYQELREWTWEANQINFVGATQAIDVLLRFEQALLDLAFITDPLGMIDAVDTLSYKTAAMCARSRGQRDLAIDLAGEADADLADLIKRTGNPTQRYPARRRSYGAGRRRLR